MEFWQYLLTGAAGAAIIKLIDNIIQWKLTRKAKLEDKADERQEQRAQEVESRWSEMERQIGALTDGQKFILLDRIQHLGRAYLRDGEVDFDDRRRLHQMHEAYHALGGNGDLNKLMQDVDELELKE